MFLFFFREKQAVCDDFSSINSKIIVKHHINCKVAVTVVRLSYEYFLVSANNGE